MGIPCIYLRMLYFIYSFLSFVLLTLLYQTLFILSSLMPHFNSLFFFEKLLILEFQIPFMLVSVYVVLLQFSSVAQSCLTLCDPMNCSTPGLPVHHQLPEFTQTRVHWVSGAIQPSHPLSSPSPPAFNLFQHQGLFKWVSSLHQVVKIFEFQLQNQSFQWIARTDFL